MTIPHKMPQSRRLLATLSSIPTSTPSPTFVPPYAHSGPSSSPARSTKSSGSTLRPPYAHSVKPTRPAKALTAPYAFKYASPTTGVSADGAGNNVAVAPHQASERWAAWAREQLASPSAAVALWQETLEKLAVLAEGQQGQGVQAQVQEVSAIDIPAFLRDEAKVALVKEAGSLVVRDAVPDHLALGWAREVADELRARGGDGTSCPSGSCWTSLHLAWWADESGGRVMVVWSDSHGPKRGTRSKFMLTHSYLLAPCPSRRPFQPFLTEHDFQRHHRAHVV